MQKGKLYLAHFEFYSGEAEIPFHHTLWAASMEEARRRVEEYLREFAAEPERVGYLSYLYWDGYYGVKYKGLEETTPERVVRYLRI